MPREPAALALVAGATVARVLVEFGADCRLKWPNDLYRPDSNDGWRKVGGILCEMRSGSEGARLVVGVGLNLLPASAQGLAEDEREQTSVRGCTVPLAPRAVAAGSVFTSNAHAPPRDRLVEALGVALHRAARRFLREGFAPFAGDWRRLDCLHGQSVAVHRADGSRTVGVARGIDEDGALLVELVGRAGACLRIVSDEVSIRFA